MPYTLEGASEQLMIANAIRSLEFYVCETDGKKHSFAARCWDQLNTMKDAEKFVEELNAAIRPVRQRWLDKIVEDVQREFPSPRLR